MQPTPTPPPTTPTTAPDPTTAVEVLSVIGIWFGGIVTAVAVGVALWISHRDWARADAERRDQEKAQARLVEIARRGGSLAGVAVYNHSKEPVFDVVPEFILHYDDPDLRGHPADGAPLPMLDAGRDRFCGATVRRHNGELLGSQEYRSSPVRYEEMSVTFTDAAGRRWRRRGRTEPVRITD